MHTRSHPSSQTSLYGNYLGCILENEMRARLLILILVLSLSVANTGAAAICATYCGSSESAAGGAVHHHQAGSAPNTTSARAHVHRHGTPCAECPSTTGISLNQNSDCAKLVEVQALKEGSFSLGAPTGNAQAYVAEPPTDALKLIGDGERSLRLEAPQTTRSSGTPPIPLRI
jgi:hypothetical protein